VRVEDLKGQTIAMAVSGGLDSCTITRWLTDHGLRVVALTADLAQPDEANVQDIRRRMQLCGAAEAAVVDGRAALARAGLEVIQGQARYEGGYWNTTGIARYVTVATLLPEVRRRNIKILGHGATGRGNDQVRFQLAANMLAPELAVYAPWRDPAFLASFPGRKEMIEFCEHEELPIKATLEQPYSTDANMLGLTHEAGRLEFLDTPAQFVTPEMGVYPHDAPATPERFSVRFEAGVPVALNERPEGVVEAFLRANAIAGRHGVGIGLHTVENRFVGIKSRGVYEAPGMELLGRCYDFVLQLILDRRARTVFDDLSMRLGRQIYESYWYDLASTALRRAIGEFTRLATATITVELYKGNVAFISAADAPHSLYTDASSMEAVGEFDHTDSEGFVRVLGVSARVLHAGRQVQDA